MNVMREIKVGKVVINMGVGEGGRKLSNAEGVLKEITGQTPARTYAKQTNQTIGIREGTPVGCKVTLRKERAIANLKKLLKVKGMEIKESSFDENGNFSFGIKEHIEIPDLEYEPDIGIFGMDVNVSLERPGFRIKKRRRRPRPVPKSHRIDKEEAVEFVEQNLNVEVV